MQTFSTAIILIVCTIRVKHGNSLGQKVDIGATYAKSMQLPTIKMVRV